MVSQCNESLKQSHFSKTQVDQQDYQTNRKCQNTQIQLIKNNQNSYTINNHNHSYYAHCKYSRKFNDRRILHIHTPHNRDLSQQDDKLETNKRIGTDSSHSENERETQQNGDLLFVCGKWEGYSQWAIQFTLSHKDRDCPYERKRGAHDPAPLQTMLMHRLHVDL